MVLISVVKYQMVVESGVERQESDKRKRGRERR